MSGLADRRLQAQPTFEEAWFIEGSLDNERAFWLRYTLSRHHGKTQAAVWATVVEGDLIQAAREQTDLPATPDDALVDTPQGRLTPTRATGHVGPLQWDLALDARTGHDHVPERLARLGLTGRHYASPGLDLRVSGSLAVGDISLALHDAPAAFGHIWGPRATTRAWAWAHCNAFEHHPDARFEALSARLGMGPLTLPWATSAVIEVLGHRRAFTRTRTLFRTTSAVGPADWRIDARHEDTRLRAHLRMPLASSVVRVGLSHANGRRTRVHNSPLAQATIQLLDPQLGDVRLKSHRASLELALSETAGSPPWQPHLQG